MNDGIGFRQRLSRLHSPPWLTLSHRLTPSPPRSKGQGASTLSLKVQIVCDSLCLVLLVLRGTISLNLLQGEMILFKGQMQERMGPGSGGAKTMYWFYGSKRTDFRSRGQDR